MQVQDVMTRNVISLREHAEFKEILLVLRERGFSAFPVLDADDHVIGVVSEDDLLVREAYAGQERTPRFLLRHADLAKAEALTAKDLMTSPALTIGPSCTVAEAAKKMHVKRLTRLPVVNDDGRLLGIVSRIDLLGVYDRPDSEIRSEIIDRVLGTEFTLDKLGFTVEVRAGIVTISGVVESGPVALSLLDAIRQVEGVVAVRDRLRYPNRY